MAVLTFIGGVFGGIGAAVWYLSTLATTAHVDNTVSGAMDPLNRTVASLNGTVANLSGTVDNLKETVGGLEGTVGGLEAAVGALNALSSTVGTLSELVGTLNRTVEELGGSVDTLSNTFPRLASCVIELHGPWDGGRVDARPYRRGQRFELPDICRQARDFVNPRPASGR